MTAWTVRMWLGYGELEVFKGLSTFYEGFGRLLILIVKPFALVLIVRGLARF